jgi:hypothetical protein
VIVEVDHLLLVARDPESTARELGDVLGLAAAGGGVHTAIGTRNALLSLGGPYLEVIGLADDDPATAARAAGHPIGAAVLRALGARAAAGGGAWSADSAVSRASGPVLATLALRSDDVATDVARLRAAGARLDPSTVSRRRPDGSTVSWPVAFPACLGPEEPAFLIEHAPGEPERAARVAGGLPRLVGVTFAVADPARAAAGWLATLGICFARDAPSPGAERAAARPSAVSEPAWSPPDALRARVGPHEVVLARSRPGAPAATVGLSGSRLDGGAFDLPGVRFVAG